MNGQNSDQIIQSTQSTLEKLTDNTFNWHTLLVFVVAIAVAYLLSHLVGGTLRLLARLTGSFGDIATTSERTLRLRRIETYLGVGIAVMRVVIFAAAIFVAWSATHASHSSNSIALIGASTIFIILGGATLQPLLKDITAGSVMIAEGWFNVGDFITIDPFYGDAGIVERMNLRSTRIRKIDGEVLWIHNQYITRAAVSPNGVRTLALDLFVNDLEKGKELVAFLKNTLSVGPTMLARPLELSYTQKLTEKMWRITVIGQTAPGREWLLEKFAVDITKENDKDLNGDNPALLYDPLARYADPAAERRFKRAVRIKASKAKTTNRMAELALTAQTRYHEKQQERQARRARKR